MYNRTSIFAGDSVTMSKMRRKRTLEVVLLVNPLQEGEVVVYSSLRNRADGSGRVSVGDTRSRSTIIIAIHVLCNDGCIRLEYYGNVYCLLRSRSFVLCREVMKLISIRRPVLHKKFEQADPCDAPIITLGRLK